MKTLVIANQKGGVGKSTLAALLAWWLQDKQHARVAAFDLDNQQNLSRTLKAYDSGMRTVSFFKPEPIEIFASEKAITLFSADASLADLERSKPEILRTFRRHLSSLHDKFDYCVIDTPPTIGLRMSAALIAGDYVLCPIELEEYSIEGLTAMLKAIFGIRQKYNPQLKFLGVLANRFNPHSVRQKEALQQLVTQYSEFMIPTKISTRSAIPEALAAGIPVWQLAKSSARDASAEVLQAFELLRKRMGEQAEASMEDANAAA